MSQNIYDQPDFFHGYSQLPRSRDGLDAAAEWPAMQALLPPLEGTRIVDLGCGFGWFCRWASARHARSILGIDLSENMLARARGFGQDAAITYIRRDMETLELPPAVFDLAYSSLALHYVSDLTALLQTIHDSLLPDGHFVFSTEHPIYTAPSHPDWAQDATGARIWPLNDYQKEGPRSTDWLAPGVIKQHRTLGTLINALIDTGFTVTHVEEWSPTDRDLTAHPDWAPERDRPTFLLIAARKQAAP
ncbi:class I SAM-dependent methyltransferase [Komagataeibacter oboediens]|uniref:class I SAM-dependent methyltransferase n=1 Tax=Komagataeibacter oboediens TaxID=65958 RepID=UPI001C2DBE4D|nr:class I SAM-dependent methyltransferase [Komagataeibacter oboediens]MBV1823579.1 class I SAM-dependent methyltransferase [Komagataeibacter oboediens]